MSAAGVAPEALIERLRKFDANARWANEHVADLAKHEGLYVAIDGRKVLGVSKSAQDLRKRFADRPDLYVTFVSPPGLAWLL